MVMSFTGIEVDLEQRTGLEMVLVLGNICQIRDAFEISMGEMFSRAVEYLGLEFRDDIG